ncbi:MAG: STAS domain-containing protein [Alphaproteobacteria bacterium]|nr:STAS domain-containing protein [Alphaproteobacteria bacterium]
MADCNLEADGVLALPAVADSLYAGPLKEELVRRLASNAPIDVDASAVQRIATTCLQVLLAANRRPAAAETNILSISGASAAFEEAVTLLGLRRELGMREV